MVPLQLFSLTISFVSRPYHHYILLGCFAAVTVSRQRFCSHSPIHVTVKTYYIADSSQVLFHAVLIPSVSQLTYRGAQYHLLDLVYFFLSHVKGYSRTLRSLSQRTKDLQLLSSTGTAYSRRMKLCVSQGLACSGISR